LCNVPAFFPTAGTTCAFLHVITDGCLHRMNDC
jgi:hypothetical protein